MGDRNSVAPPPGARPMGGNMFITDDGQKYRKTTILDHPRFAGNEDKARDLVMHPAGAPLLALGQAKFEPEFIPVGGPDNARGAIESAPSPYGPARRIDNDARNAEIGLSESVPVEEVPSYDPKNPKKNAVPNDKDLKSSAKKLNKVAPPGERLAYINPAEEALLKSIGGSGKPSWGVPSYKKGDVSPPPPRNYGQETRDTLQAQVDLAPQLYANEAEVPSTICRA